VIVTIWIALALFVAGEFRRPWLFLAGGILAAAHLAWAMQDVYGWDHGAAIDATARQTQAIFGVDWGGGVFVNYAFVGVWIADAIARIAAPALRTRAVTWTLRAFYFVVIANAAVIFASPGRRWAGLVICVLIAVAWSRHKSTHEGSRKE